MARKSTGELELEQDLSFQRWQWRVERAGWGLLALVILAAFLGLIGGYGPLRTASASADGDALRLEYDRFVRLRAATELRFLASPDLVGGGELEVFLTSDYADEIEIASITPGPDTVTRTPDQTRVDESDILAAGRELQGLGRLDQIKYAVLERSGGISIIPKGSS
ncbi:MAG: hypothetical protein M3377_02105 [Actinomycetota bacterium]|nr:hypothetical protein [Actinomycetota bacterium]